MAIWHWRRCGERPTDAITESLLNAADAADAHLGGLPPRSRATGRTSIDSSLSCVVCMDVAINCV
jgi:hypothetical protein